jgi:hypothetical protein
MPGPRSTVSLWARRRAFQIRRVMSFQLDRYTAGADRVDGWVRTTVSLWFKITLFSSLLRCDCWQAVCFEEGGRANSKRVSGLVPAHAHDPAWAARVAFGQCP